MIPNKIIEPATEEELEKYFQLRYEVLRKPWNQPQSSTKDEWEDKSIHILMLGQDGMALATGRLQLNSKEEGQVRSMAVRPEYQNQKLGSAVLLYIEERARQIGLHYIILDARDKAIGFYEKHGYQPISESYILFEVIPHVRMKKFL